jgi:hypothetical protein
MSKMPTDALRSAIGALRLKDILLRAARFSLPTPFTGKSMRANEFVKRAVEYKRIEGEKNSLESLEILVGLGVRIAAGSGEKPAPIYVEIEADFIAEYEIAAAISEEAIKAFAGYNAVHNVWPFWRQHVFDIVNRAHLLHIDIPLYSGTPPGGVTVSESKSSARSEIASIKPKRVRRLKSRRNT